MKASILLVEDDTSLGMVLSDQLRQDGYRVTHCADGDEALRSFNESVFHLCIVDVMLPKKDGFTLTREIRKLNDQVPVLFLTAKSMTEDKVEGFKAGADDYMTKPFSLEELQVRVKALLRRINITEETTTEKISQIGTYVFDQVNFTLTHPLFTKSLTKKEAQIIRILLQFKNEVVPRGLVLSAVWGQDDYFVGRSLDVFITKLRKYFKEDPSIQIANIHGIGFKLSF